MDKRKTERRDEIRSRASRYNKNIAEQLTDTNEERYFHEQLEIDTTDERFNALGNTSTNDTEIANTDKIGIRQFERQRERKPTRNSWEQHWYEVAAELCRVDDGLREGLDKSDRIKRFESLGNAIVPQVAQVILRAIKDGDNI